MASIKISIEEQFRLRDSAKDEILRLEKYYRNLEEVQVVEAFKNKFNVCESAYKVIFIEHQSRKGKDLKGYPKLNMTQIPHALKFAGYSFDKQLLKELFASSSTANGKTAKMLRDSTTHSIDQSAVNEIIRRKNELWQYMEFFVDTIKNFDINVKVTPKN